MPFPGGGGVASQLARQLGPRGGSLGGILKSGLYTYTYTHTHTYDRLDKSRSALAEAWLKSLQFTDFIVMDTKITAFLHFPKLIQRHTNVNNNVNNNGWKVVEICEEERIFSKIFNMFVWTSGFQKLLALTDFNMFVDEWTSANESLAWGYWPGSDYNENWGQVTFSAAGEGTPGFFPLTCHNLVFWFLLDSGIYSVCLGVFSIQKISSFSHSL